MRQGLIKEDVEGTLMNERLKLTGIAAFLCGLGIWALPVWVQMSEQRGTLTPLKISVSNKSLAVMAFEDVRAAFDFDAGEPIGTPLLPQAGIENLVTGVPFEFRRDQSSSVRPSASRVSTISSLSPVIISLRRPAVPRPFHGIESTGSDARAALASSALSREARRRWELVQNDVEVRDPGARLPTLRMRAAEAMKMFSPPNSKVRQIDTQSGGRILVAGADSQSPSPSPAPSQSSVDATGTMGGDNSPQPAPTTAPLPNWRMLEPNLNKARPHLIAGHLLVTGGLAFLGDQTQLRVYRSVNGTELDKGQIWVDQARFEIVVPEIKGYLVAEIRDLASNRLLGRGEIDLHMLPPPPRDQYKISNLALKLAPMPNSPTVVAASFHNLGQSSPGSLREAKLSSYQTLAWDAKEGVFEAANLSPLSTGIVATSSPGFVKTRMYSGRWSVNQLFLFPSSLADGLFAILAPEVTKWREHRGFIWGVVGRSGAAPLAGAEVELVGPTSTKRPVYFHKAYLPDPQLQSTSANGLFVFVDLEPGIYSLRAKTSAGFLSAQIVEVNPGEATQMLFEDQGARTVTVDVSNPLNAQLEVAPKISILGLDQPLELQQGENSVLVPSGSSILTLELAAQAAHESALLRLSFSSAANHLAIPLITQSFLKTVATRLKINVDESRGVAVISLRGQLRDFELSESLADVTRENFVYLDENWQPLQTRDISSAQHLLIYNLPFGIHTVKMTDESLNQQRENLFVAEENVINIIPAVR